MNHDSWLELADDYALGLLAAAERTRFEDHLGSPCPACRARVLETEEALSAFPLSLSADAPPPGVKRRLMRSIAPGIVVGPAAWTGALSAALAACLVFVTVQLRQVQDTLVRSEARASQLQRLVDEKDAKLRLVTDPSARIVPLSDPEGGPSSNRGMFLWSPETRAGLLVSNCLPQAPIDKVYQIWVLAEGRPVSAGIFVVDQKGCAAIRLVGLPDGPAFDKVAVTLEPSGGVVSPTGPMVLSGSVA